MGFSMLYDNTLISRVLLKHVIIIFMFCICFFSHISSLKNNIEHFHLEADDTPLELLIELPVSDRAVPVLLL